MKQEEKVYSFIKEKVSLEEIQKCISENKSIGVDAFEIQKKLGIVRNNASTILNELCKEGKLVKIITRPVSFIPSDILEYIVTQENNGVEFKNEYTVYELKKLFENRSSAKEKTEDPFNSLIGYDNSLLSQIGQAKAAIMYPPNGLHTLILGESGVGKTTFARTMYEYALISKNIKNNEYPFISFNCSDYFNNPQLLLSQLFGHAKGAFTGAENDKTGLVEKANGGILFLDEVHRLPPDGQEMLFQLMDKGEFHRLGETENARKSNVLVIAATTENPNDVLLTTFLRRIPVIIKLPSFREKDIGERIEVIEKLFFDEVTKLQMAIYISPEVIKALSVYKFAGNIGQLSSEIKLLCAKAFLRYLQQKQKLNIEFDMLTKDIRDYVFNSSIDGKTKEFLDLLNEDMVILPSKGEKKYNNPLDENIYDTLIEEMGKLKKQGFSEKEIDVHINETIENYFDKVVNKLNFNGYNRKQLYKIIDKEIVDFSIELISDVSKMLKMKFSNKLVFGFAFHIQSLIDRIRTGKPIKNPNLDKIKKSYPDEYEVSEFLIQKLNKKFNIDIPEDEKGFLSILIANNKLEKAEEDKIGIIVICHGESTATSMADVCNSLLNYDFVKAIDMPLDSQVSEIYNKTFATVTAMNKGKGVLLLADMGSLVDFGDKITKQSGIRTRTIKNVSTLMVLEAMRRIIYKDEDIDTIYNDLTKQESVSLHSNPKKKAVMTLCYTGQGASMISKNILTDIIGKQYNNEIEIIPFGYMDLENDSKKFAAYKEKYEFVACVGSANPKMNIPYFPVNEILNEDFRNKFIKFLDIKVYGEKTGNVEKNKDVYDISKDMLEQYVKYINPKFAVECIKGFVQEMGLKYIKEQENKLIDLIIHLGCMLDRCVHNEVVIFDDKAKFIEENKDMYDKTRKAIDKFEDTYKIKIVDDEVCYTIKVIKNMSNKL